MILSLLVLLAITVAATWWSRLLAAERGRAVGAWALTTALLPPVVLLLWLLPAKSLKAAARPS